MAIPFFLSYQVIAGWLILNLIIAAIIDGLSIAQKDRASLITKDNLDDLLTVWQKFDPELTWKMKFQDIWLFLAELHDPFLENNFKQDWDPETEPQEARYYYCQHNTEYENSEECQKYKVKRYDCFLLLKDSNFKFKLKTQDVKTQVGSKYVIKEELYVEFSELIMTILKKAFFLAQVGDEEGGPDPTKANTDSKAKMKKRIEKAKTLNKISQQMMSDRSTHYQHDDPINQMAAIMIQDAAREKFAEEFSNITFNVANLIKGGSYKNLISNPSSQGLRSNQSQARNKRGKVKNGLQTRVLNQGNKNTSKQEQRLGR